MSDGPSTSLAPELDELNLTEQRNGFKCSGSSHYRLQVAVPVHSMETCGHVEVQLRSFLTTVLD